MNFLKKAQKTHKDLKTTYEYFSKEAAALGIIKKKDEHAAPGGPGTGNPATDPAANATYQPYPAYPTNPGYPPQPNASYTANPPYQSNQIDASGSGHPAKLGFSAIHVYPDNQASTSSPPPPAPNNHSLPNAPYHQETYSQAPTYGNTGFPVTYTANQPSYQMNPPWPGNQGNPAYPGTPSTTQATSPPPQPAWHPTSPAPNVQMPTYTASEGYTNQTSYHGPSGEQAWPATTNTASPPDTRSQMPHGTPVETSTPPMPNVPTISNTAIDPASSTRSPDPAAKTNHITVTTMPTPAATSA